MNAAFVTEIKAHIVDARIGKVLHTVHYDLYREHCMSHNLDYGTYIENMLTDVFKQYNVVKVYRISEAEFQAMKA